MGIKSLAHMSYENWANEAKAARVATTNLRPDEKPSEWARRMGLPEEEKR